MLAIRRILCSFPCLSSQTRANSFDRLSVKREIYDKGKGTRFPNRSRGLRMKFKAFSYPKDTQIRPKKWNQQKTQHASSRLDGRASQINRIRSIWRYSPKNLLISLQLITCNMFVKSTSVISIGRGCYNPVITNLPVSTVCFSVSWIENRLQP